MKKLLLVLGFVFTVTAVSAISICKGTGGTGGTGGGDFPIDKTFVMTVLTPADRTFSFQISASGNYKVDWGDGTAVESITKANTTMTTYSHTYPAASTNYTAKLAGLATGYSSDQFTAAIAFNTANPQANLIGISGNLGYIFPIINNTSTGSPKFNGTFNFCSKITSSIPGNLFAGINGAPVPYMFSGLFYGCSGLTGSIPGNLFAGLSGAPATNLFAALFHSCDKLTGSIPGNLFAGISGAPAPNMFVNAFRGCANLTGPIPAGLFAGISGAPATNMFAATFYECSRLTGIPVGLFGNLSGAAASSMFVNTFKSCYSLTGQSALMPDGVTHLYEVWPSATTDHVSGMYNVATGLADYASIPAAWK